MQSYTFYYVMFSCISRAGRAFYRRYGAVYSLSFILLIFQEDFLLFAEIDAILQILEKVRDVLLLFCFCLFVVFFPILCGVPVNYRGVTFRSDLSR